MRTSFLVECFLSVLNRRVTVAKDASPWQKQALNKLDASSMETTCIREPQGPLVASSLRSERYSPGPLRLSNARSFLDSTSNLYIAGEREREREREGERVYSSKREGEYIYIAEEREKEREREREYISARGREKERERESKREGDGVSVSTYISIFCSS